MSFVDIAGIVRGASEGEGLGNKFLANIREADAIAQGRARLLGRRRRARRRHGEPPPPTWRRSTPSSCSPTSRPSTRAITRYEKEVRGKKIEPVVLETANAAKDALERGVLLSVAGIDLTTDPRAGPPDREKPVIFVFNVDEGVLTDPARKEELAALVAPAKAIFLDAKIESELIDLDPEDAAELLASTGQDESGLDQLARIGSSTPSDCRPT